MIENKKLSEITTVFADWDWIESKDQSSKWIRLIQTWNIWTWNFKDRWDKARYISEETFDRLNCTEIFPNDCLVSRLPDPVWRSCLIPELPDRLITAVDCSIIRFKDTIEPKFFVYYSQSNQYQRDVDVLCTWATRKRISRKSLWTIEIPLPPLETQKAIVAKLDQIFAELDQTKSEIQKNLDNTDELWKSALNQAFQGDWDMKKLGEVIKILTDYTANWSFASLAEHVQYKDEEDFAVLVRLKDLRKNLKNNDKVYVPEESYNFLKKSSLTWWEYLIANVWANIWDCYEMPFINKPATLWPNMYLVKFNDKVVQRYIVFMTESIIKSQIISNSVSSAQPKINKDQFKNIEIPVPPLSEQEKIVEHLDQVSKEVKALKSQYQSQLDNLEELKKSVLNKAFRWELE